MMNITRMRPFQLVVSALIVTASIQPIDSQERIDLAGALRWRSIGPYRGGRVTAVAGVARQPLIYYMGATGGGVWKTDDGGVTWANISDGFFGAGSIGAIAVADSNPNILYVGTGEGCLRG